MTWPKCPTCKRDMGVAKIGAPVQTFHLCGHCGTNTRVDPPELEQLLLFEIDDEEPT
jgi:hypothetical protein